MFYVYILASKPQGTLYIGVTKDLVRRAHEHRTGVVAGFTKKYSVHRLVHFEAHDSIEAAITREKQMKEWRRAWKIELLEKENPRWEDLYPVLAANSGAR
jgi:putative endonuclease